MSVGFTEPTTEEDRFCGHLARLEVDEFLEAKGDDVGGIDGGEHVREEGDVFRATPRLSECVGFGSVDVPRDDENVERAIGTERRLAFDEFVIYDPYVG